MTAPSMRVPYESIVLAMPRSPVPLPDLPDLSNLPTAAGGGGLWPNLLLVGAHKAATTTVHDWLSRHPQLAMSALKEPRHFVAPWFAAHLAATAPGRERLLQRVIATPPAYLALFAAAMANKPQARFRGESSPQYLYFHDLAIPAIRQTVGAPRILIILREPAERAWAAWRMLVRDRLTNASFSQLVADEGDYIRRGWPPSFHLVQMGRYARAVQAWLNAFPAVRILLYDDLCREPQRFLHGLLDWLGLKADPDQGLPARLNAGPVLTTSAADQETLRRLRAFYQSDLETLAPLVRRQGGDLSPWLS